MSQPRSKATRSTRPSAPVAGQRKAPLRAPARPPEGRSETRRRAAPPVPPTEASKGPPAKHESGTRIRAAEAVPELLADAPLAVWIAEARHQATKHVTSAELLAAAIEDVARAAETPPSAPTAEAPVDVDQLIRELKDLAASHGEGELALTVLWAERAPTESLISAANSWCTVLLQLGKSLSKSADWILDQGGERRASLAAFSAPQIVKVARLAVNVARAFQDAARAANEQKSAEAPTADPTAAPTAARGSR